MTRLLALLLFLPAACAGVAPRPPVQTFTPAELRKLSPQELYLRLIGPDGVDKVTWGKLAGRGYLSAPPVSGAHIGTKSTPFGPDLCVRRRYYVGLDPLKWRRRGNDREDIPLRVARILAIDEPSLAPACADLPGRGFAQMQSGISFAEGVAILRTLAAARDAAAGTGPLPFRLRCDASQSHERFECPADLRATLAGLPLHRAEWIDRPPYYTPILCAPEEPSTGDSVEISLDDKSGHLWEVRLRAMGSEQAEVVLTWRLAREAKNC